eukprot:9876485-Alexandrium_andersonii.AAC.1
MSASLVGSEMCIRDRNLHRAALGWTELPGAVFAPQGARSFGGFETPVSYTHLTLPTICSV